MQITVIDLIITIEEPELLNPSDPMHLILIIRQM